MSKLYLLCELDDEDYAYASHSFYKTYEEAKREATKSCKDLNEDCEIEIEDEGFRITARYEGVDFEVRYQGTYEECTREMKKEIKELVDNYELADEDICDNVIDTGNEWEVFDIVKI